jgi:hypothetical protein
MVYLMNARKVITSRILIIVAKNVTNPVVLVMVLQKISVTIAKINRPFSSIISVKNVMIIVSVAIQLQNTVTHAQKIKFWIK